MRAARVWWAGVLVAAATLAVIAWPRADEPLRFWTCTRTWTDVLHDAPDGAVLRPPWRAAERRARSDYIALIEVPSAASRWLITLGLRSRYPSSNQFAVLLTDGDEWDEWLVLGAPWPRRAAPDPALAGTWRLVPSRTSRGGSPRERQLVLRDDGTGRDGMNEPLQWGRTGDVVVLDIDFPDPARRRMTAGPAAGAYNFAAVTGPGDDWLRGSHDLRWHRVREAGAGPPALPGR